MAPRNAADADHRGKRISASNCSLLLERQDEGLARRGRGRSTDLRSRRTRVTRAEHLSGSRQFQGPSTGFAEACDVALRLPAHPAHLGAAAASHRAGELQRGLQHRGLSVVALLGQRHRQAGSKGPVRRPRMRASAAGRPRGGVHGKVREKADCCDHRAETDQAPKPGRSPGRRCAAAAAAHGCSSRGLLQRFGVRLSEREAPHPLIVRARIRARTGAALGAEREVQRAAERARPDLMSRRRSLGSASPGFLTREAMRAFRNQKRCNADARAASRG